MIPLGWLNGRMHRLIQNKPQYAMAMAAFQEGMSTDMPPYRHQVKQPQIVKWRERMLDWIKDALSDARTQDPDLAHFQETLVQVFFTNSCVEDLNKFVTPRLSKRDLNSLDKTIPVLLDEVTRKDVDGYIATWWALSAPFALLCVETVLVGRRITGLPGILESLQLSGTSAPDVAEGTQATAAQQKINRKVKTEPDLSPEDVIQRTTNGAAAGNVSAIVANALYDDPSWNADIKPTPPTETAFPKYDDPRENILQQCLPTPVTIGATKDKIQGKGAPRPPLVCPPLPSPRSRVHVSPANKEIIGGDLSMKACPNKDKHSLKQSLLSSVTVGLTTGKGAPLHYMVCPPLPPPHLSSLSTVGATKQDIQSNGFPRLVCPPLPPRRRLLADPAPKEIIEGNQKIKTPARPLSVASSVASQSELEDGPPMPVTQQHIQTGGIQKSLFNPGHGSAMENGPDVLNGPGHNYNDNLSFINTSNASFSAWDDVPALIPVPFINNYEIPNPSNRSNPQQQRSGLNRRSTIVPVRHPTVKDEDSEINVSPSPVHHLKGSLKASNLEKAREKKKKAQEARRKLQEVWKKAKEEGKKKVDEERNPFEIEVKKEADVEMAKNDEVQLRKLGKRRSSEPDEEVTVVHRYKMRSTSAIAASVLGAKKACVELKKTNFRSLSTVVRRVSTTSPNTTTTPSAASAFTDDDATGVGSIRIAYYVDPALGPLVLPESEGCAVFKKSDRHYPSFNSLFILYIVKDPSFLEDKILPELPMAMAVVDEATGRRTLKPVPKQKKADTVIREIIHNVIYKF